MLSAIGRAQKHSSVALSVVAIARLAFTAFSWRAKPSALRPLRLRPLLLFAVHLKVHLLVEEGQVSLYLGGLQDRLRVVPDQVLDSLAPGLDRPVRGDPLVRAPSGLLAPNEHVLAHVLGRDVVARRQPGLE